MNAVQAGTAYEAGGRVRYWDVSWGGVVFQAVSCIHALGLGWEVVK
jgi:hypothetical protein